MGLRRGRPRKEWTQVDRQKMALADDIVDQLRYETNGLTNEQIRVLKNTLDETFRTYSIEKEQIIDDENKTVKEINFDAIEEFLQSKRVESKSQTTIYNYGNELRKMFTVVDKDYRKITTEDVRDYMDYRKNKCGLSPTSIQNIRMYLMSFYKWAVINEKIYRNPMDKISTIKREKKVIDTLSDEEAEIIRCSCDNERDLAIIDLLSGSGMRVSELTRLNIRDVNFETNEIKVYGKGAKERICFLTGKAKVHLRWYLQSRTDDNEALFVTAKKPFTRLSKNGVEYVLKSIAKKTGISRLRLYPHKYRSTFATNLLNKGADLSTISTMMGHSNVDTTLSVYCDYKTDTLKRDHSRYVS